MKTSKKPSLRIKNLHVAVEKKHILNGLDLTIKQGELHVVMGPNGSGKSTLANVLMGHPAYDVVTKKTSSTSRPSIKIDSKEFVDASAQERAKAGLFLAFQSPIAIPGVTVSNLLRTAYQELHPAKPDRHAKKAPYKANQWKSGEMSLGEFMKELKRTCKRLSLDESFLSRGIHDGFSGGERKKVEMLQALMLQPKFAMFDEIDTGLDVDALKVVATGIQALKEENTGILVITHYQRILRYLTPDYVHVLSGGEIVKTGDAHLAKDIEEHGYSSYATAHH